MKGQYHYEYAAYTDNLCYGRILICRGRDRQHVERTALNSGKGCYVIERVRVANA